MLTLLYPYRDRDLTRVKRSFESLRKQSDTNFDVVFVDYGSCSSMASEAKELVAMYEFAEYRYYPTQYQPWNKGRALNSVIKELDKGYFFVADVDMIFHSEFIATAVSLQQSNSAVYFQVGFLDEAETKLDKSFEDYRINFTSSEGATGLTMFPIAAVHPIRGFDEFYHFWGAEDTDIHIRLKNNGTQIKYYDERLLMLHQWHPSYRSKESNKLTKALRLRNIVSLNHEHVKRAEQDKATIVNPEGWGAPLTKTEFNRLQNDIGKTVEYSNKNTVIDHLLFCELPNLSEEIHTITIIEDNTEKSLKHQAKKRLGKRVPEFYTMKTVNDMLLLHIISFYRNYAYIYRVLDNGSRLQLTIQRPTKKTS